MRNLLKLYINTRTLFLTVLFALGFFTVALYIEYSNKGDLNRVIVDRPLIFFIFSFMVSSICALQNVSKQFYMLPASKLKKFMAQNLAILFFFIGIMLLSGVWEMIFHYIFGGNIKPFSIILRRPGIYGLTLLLIWPISIFWGLLFRKLWIAIILSYALVPFIMHLSHKYDGYVLMFALIGILIFWIDYLLYKRVQPANCGILKI